MLNFANSPVGYKNWCFISTKFDFERSGKFAEISYSLHNKIFVCILIFLFFSKSGIQYLWQGEISICKVVVLINVVPEKNDYFLYQNSNCIYSKWMVFLIGAVFTEKTFGAYISYELIVWLISTWIWYDLLTVSHFWPSNH